MVRKLRSSKKVKLSTKDKFSKKDTDKAFKNLGSYGDGMKK